LIEPVERARLLLAANHDIYVEFLGVHEVRGAKLKFETAGNDSPRSVL
jgi:hypothetical protein